VSLKLKLTELSSSNDIYTNMLTYLGEQDNLLAGLYDELLNLDKEVQTSIEGFVSRFEGVVDEAGGVGKGCRVTISNAVSGGLE